MNRTVAGSGEHEAARRVRPFRIRMPPHRAYLLASFIANHATEVKKARLSKA